MKFLVDMNLSPKWVSVLNTFGWRSIHWSSVGKPTATDSELMDFAREHGYVVLTHDLDFSAILAVTHGEKPSVVQIRTDDISPLGATKVITALSQFEGSRSVDIYRPGSHSCAVAAITARIVKH
jgi:predicted nuclease of predicted toxin-antitoxin system